ncbi:hypothetical protein FXW78_33315 [Rhodococcus opacus]|nr:hypothetical protein [Rhodococcus opacus]
MTEQGESCRTDANTTTELRCAIDSARLNPEFCKLSQDIYCVGMHRRSATHATVPALELSTLQERALRWRAWIEDAYARSPLDVAQQGSRKSGYHLN